MQMGISYAVQVMGHAVPARAKPSRSKTASIPQVDRVYSRLGEFDFPLINFPKSTAGISPILHLPLTELIKADLMRSSIFNKQYNVLAILGSITILFFATRVGHAQQTATVVSAGQVASEMVATLTPDQKKITVLPADSPLQVGWHFIPKDDRKGLELNAMNESQRAQATTMLTALLSQMGMNKTTQIMGLEKLLKELQDKAGGKGPVRDHLRYYVTFFGEPGKSGRWGVSFEGHHLSLNYVIENDKIVSSSPQFFATNPAIVKNENNAAVSVGTRVLRFEETVAFELVQTLSEKQSAMAIIAEKAPREIRAAGEPQPRQEDPVGISWRDLSDTQRKLIRRLMMEYVNAVPKKIADERRQSIKEGGYGKIHFAWAGPTVPGIGHYYRIQSPTFLIEFVNTQPDAAGNPANHIHCVWRDMRGDFGKPIGG